MASLFRRQRSPYWWVKYRDRSGKIVRASTQCRCDDTLETRKAKEIRAARTAAELSDAPATHPSHLWEAWVLPHLEAVHGNSKRTLERYRIAWNNVREFLLFKGIKVPARVMREHALEYLAWRGRKIRGMQEVVHNTALFEVKVGAKILNEATKRRYLFQNPWLGLGIRRNNPKEKPELTEAQMDEIETTILAQPDPPRQALYASFIIARYQGCRLSETHIDPRSAVELIDRPDGSAAGIIRFHIKGNRVHSTGMHPNLIPFFRELKSRNASETYPWPGRARSAMARVWFGFLRHSGLKKKIPGLSFHCLRVTAITRMARAGVSESKAMRVVGHATTTIHRQYQRLRTEDLDDCFAAIASVRPKPLR